MVHRVGPVVLVVLYLSISSTASCSTSQQAWPTGALLQPPLLQLSQELHKITQDFETIRLIYNNHSNTKRMCARHSIM